MAANFISKDEVSQKIVNAFLQRRLQYIITALKKLEIATARHRANKEAAVTDSSTNDEYSVHGYIKGAYIVLRDTLHYLKKRRRLSLSNSSFYSTIYWFRFRYYNATCLTHTRTLTALISLCIIQSVISKYSKHFPFFTTQPLHYREEEQDFEV